MTLPNLNQINAASFFRLLYGDDAPGWLVLCTIDSGAIHVSPQPAAQFEATGELAARVSQKHNLYFGIGLQSEKPVPVIRDGKEVPSRGDAAGVCAIPGLWLDIDIAGPAHKSTNLPPSLDAVHELLAKLPMQPTTIVHSGNGVHCWWLFKELWTFDDEAEQDEAANLVRQFQNTFIYWAKERGWKLDNTSDLARVLRPPGTWNHKSQPPKPVRVIELDPERRYNQSDFESYLLEVDQLPKAAEPMEQTIIAGGRNAALTSIAGTMRRRGMTKEEILAALQAVNAQRCRPMLPQSELETIANSVAKYTPEAPAKQHYQCTDMGNVERLVEQYGADLKYCHPWNKWLVWDGKRWAEDITGEVITRAMQTVRSIYNEVSAATDENDRKRLLSHAVASESNARIRAMVSLAQAARGIPMRPDDLDKDPWQLNVNNGTIDLRTGTLKPHNRADLFTKLAPVDYIPDADCSRWKQFLYEIMGDNKELVDFLQRAFGLSLTGDVSEHALFVFYGTGRNGKSTCLNTIMRMLGDYAVVAAPDLLMAKNDRHPTELADLFGRRFVTAIESGEGRRLAEDLVKQLTGDDAIKARRMREDFWQFFPTHKLFLATNHKPQIRGTDRAIWNRVKLIPFEVSFPDGDPRQDKQLPQKLQAELPGILAWAVQGCLEWQKHGLGTPEAVRKATAEYQAEQDVIGQFIAECCHASSYSKVPAKVMYSAYCQWCTENGERTMTQRTFGSRLSERGLRRERGTGNHYYWIGIEVTRVTDMESGNQVVPCEVDDESNEEESPFA